MEPELHTVLSQSWKADGTTDTFLYMVMELELHTALAQSGEADGGSAEVLLRDTEKWEMVRQACPNMISLRRETGKGSLAAILGFRNEDDAAKAFVSFWGLRLNGVHGLTPKLNFASAAARTRVDGELRSLFVAHMSAIRDGPLVNDLSEAAEKVRLTIEATRSKLKKHMRIRRHAHLRGILEDMSFRYEQTSLAIAEFKRAIDVLTRAVSNSAHDERGAEVFALRGSELDWNRVHSILERECGRLEVRLPLYGHRSNILSQIYSNQVTVLAGETGSGKSTQLVQYLADAGYVEGGKSVVCTLPRKIAARALSERVAEESANCVCSTKTFLPVGDVTSVPGDSCSQRWAAISFTTDFVLLQLCLTDSTLEQFSCVVVDEAHERSLNTDLLLPLLKSCLMKRPDLKVVIMSATADTELLSSYFSLSGKVLHIPGRNFPVQIVYEPKIQHAANALQKIEEQEEQFGYLTMVMQKVLEIHKMEKEGTILAFLTSPLEVDWACRQDFNSSALVLPFYGKLPQEDLQRVFDQSTTGKRKIVFATNFAETSLTIPDVRFVVDCGFAKDSVFDPRSGMNVVAVGKIDRSSAMQRAGRAGRTRAGICYRLYSELQFQQMDAHRLPEIKRVHLGLAILKLVAMGIKEPAGFDFVEAPDPQTIVLALQDLFGLGAVNRSSIGEHYLTILGWKLVRLGIEPRLGKLLLNSIDQGYGKDGLVIAALMSNGGRNIFYRSGSEEMKARADRLRMRFCHPHGDVFTLLSVYQEWDALYERQRHSWCVLNSISFKGLRKCRDQIKEMKACLESELNLTLPSAWGWSPRDPLECSTPLRKIIFESMADNLAVFSGHNMVGYNVLSRDQKTAYLHPASAVLIYGAMPDYVVFGEMSHTSCTFLGYVTVIDPGWILSLCPPNLRDDVSVLQKSIMRKLVVQVASGGLLARVLGEEGRSVKLLAEKIRRQQNQRCIIEHNYVNNTLVVFTPALQMQEAERLVRDSIERARKMLANECMEQTLIPNSCAQMPSPTFIFGAGGAVKDMLMPGDFAAVEVKYDGCSRLEEADDGELSELFNQCGDGISGFSKCSIGPRGLTPKSSVRHEGDALQTYEWAIVQFSTRAAARVAVELLDGATLKTAELHVTGVARTSLNNVNRSPVPAVKATLAWARRRRKGRAFVTCFSPEDQAKVLSSCDARILCGSYVWATTSGRKQNAIFISSLDPGVDEQSLERELFEISGCRVLDVYMPRASAPASQPSNAVLQELLSAEISLFVPFDKFHVTVYTTGERAYEGRAAIRFDDSVHEEGTRALAHLEGTSLPGFEWWQTISHKRVFSAQLHCSSLVFVVIKDDLVDLISALEHQHPDAKIVVLNRECKFHFLRIQATSLAVTAGCKSAIEKLLEGDVVADEGLGEAAIKLVFTKRGAQLTKSVEVRTRTLVMQDKRTQTAKIYGSREKKAAARTLLLDGLARLHHDANCNKVYLRGDGMPAGLMREIVKVYGPDLQALEDLAGVGVSIKVDHREHVLVIEGGNMEAQVSIQAAITKVVDSLVSQSKLLTAEKLPENWNGESEEAQECPICFCPKEDPCFFLEGCGHGFCRSCLTDQINSSIRHRDGFPLSCAQSGCSQVFSLTDLRALLTLEQLGDLQNASLSAFVGQSHGNYRFCATPDCPNVYEISKDEAGLPFGCAACSVWICRACHVEYHEGLSCEEYRKFKLDPDVSLHAWRKGKDVKNCSSCSSVIEKIDGCNHMTCKCGKHVCWLCLSAFGTAESCCDHLKSLHGGIYGNEMLEES